MRRTRQPKAQSLPADVAARSRVAIIRADYNLEFTLKLESSCVETLLAGGIAEEKIHRVAVPGCFEIPVMAQRLAKLRRYDVLIALGAVIRGDTYHFELVANECARGVMEVSLKYDVPVIFEVLAVYRKYDAAKRGDKGIEAASAALSMLTVLDSLKK